MLKIDLTGKTVLVTGAAGFIGNNLVLELLRTVTPIHVVGVDVMSEYNPIEMKEWRLEQIKKESEKHPSSYSAPLCQDKFFLKLSWILKKIDFSFFSLDYPLSVDI